MVIVIPAFEVDRRDGPRLFFARREPKPASAITYANSLETAMPKRFGIVVVTGILADPAAAEGAKWNSDRADRTMATQPSQARKGARVLSRRKIGEMHINAA